MKRNTYPNALGVQMIRHIEQRVRDEYPHNTSYNYILPDSNMTSVVPMVDFPDYVILKCLKLHLNSFFEITATSPKSQLPYEVCCRHFESVIMDRINLLIPMFFVWLNYNETLNWVMNLFVWPSCPNQSKRHYWSRMIEYRPLINKAGGRLTARAHEVWKLLVKFRVSTFPIALTSDKLLGRCAAEMPVKFNSDTINKTSNLAASRLSRLETTFGGKIFYCLVNTGLRRRWGITST